ncbi:MAG: hypothetical protein LBS09_10110 [Bacteroidales bacterium]|nr:hypothetical protein [Bacteroidales bacterium]
MIEIDKIPDSVWTHVIFHSKEFSWNFLAVKIMLARLNLKIDMHKSNTSIIQECCGELRGLLKKSANIPNARADLEQIIHFASSPEMNA